MMAGCGGALQGWVRPQQRPGVRVGETGLSRETDQQAVRTERDLL